MTKETIMCINTPENITYFLHSNDDLVSKSIQFKMQVNYIKKEPQFKNTAQKKKQFKNIFLCILSNQFKFLTLNKCTPPVYFYKNKQIKCQSRSIMDWGKRKVQGSLPPLKMKSGSSRFGFIKIPRRGPDQNVRKENLPIFINCLYP